MVERLLEDCWTIY